jgi:hypothetical protein
MLSPAQLPPRALGASDNVWIVPAATDTFFSFPCAKKPIRLHLEKKGWWPAISGARSTSDGAHELLSAPSPYMLDASPGRNREGSGSGRGLVVGHVMPQPAIGAVVTGGAAHPRATPHDRRDHGRGRRKETPRSRPSPSGVDVQSVRLVSNAPSSVIPPHVANALTQVLHHSCRMRRTRCAGTRKDCQDGSDFITSAIFDTFSPENACRPAPSRTNRSSPHPRRRRPPRPARRHVGRRAMITRPASSRRDERANTKAFGSRPFDTFTVRLGSSRVAFTVPSGWTDVRKLNRDG